MQDHTVAFSQSDWNSDGTGNVRLELENSHDPNNPYFTPMVRESKRTNFEKGQLKMGHLMDERLVVGIRPLLSFSLVDSALRLS